MKRITMLLLVAGSITIFACGNNNSSTSNTDSAKKESDGMSSDNSSNTNTQSGTGTTGAVDSKTAEFVTKAATGGMMEVEMGKMAQQMGQSKRVKSFGAMMVEDHTKANEELKSIAQTKNITLPATVDEKQKSHLDEMMKMKGKDFDKHYTDMMVNDHKEDISLFESQSTGGTDTAIKAFATKTLPVLKKHMDSINAIASKN